MCLYCVLIKSVFFAILYHNIDSYTRSSEAAGCAAGGDVRSGWVISDSFDPQNGAQGSGRMPRQPFCATVSTRVQHVEQLPPPMATLLGGEALFWI